MNLSKILTSRTDLSASERSLVTYIVDHRQEVLGLSIQALAKAAYVSPSTVVRLCQKLGLKGFAQFKIQLAADLQKGEETVLKIDPDFPVSENDSFFEISHNLLELEKQTLQMTYEGLDAAAYEKAASLLDQAGRVALFANGDSFLDLLSFQNRMMKLSKSIQFTPLPGEQNFLVQTLNPNDVAIIVSYRGLSQPLNGIFSALIENEVPMILVTSNPNTPVSDEKSVILDLPKTENPIYKLSTFAACFSIQYVLNLLYLVYFKAHFAENKTLRLKAEKKVLDHH